MRTFLIALSVLLWGPPRATASITVPNVIGMTNHQAFETLHNDGLAPFGIPYPNNSVPENVVWSQSPKAGTVLTCTCVERAYYSYNADSAGGAP